MLSGAPPPRPPRRPPRQALYWVDAPNEELVHAPRRAGEAVPEPREEAAGAPAVAAIGDSPRDGASP